MDAHSPWMTEEHAMLQEMARRFFEAELVPNVERWRAQKFVDREFWLKAGEAGLLGASIPEEYGGSGGDQSFDVLIGLEQGRVGDSGWGFGVHSIVVHYLVAYGTDDQKACWLPRLASGELISAIAMTEPGTGSDLQAVRTTALKDGDHYVLNGAKTFITNGQMGNFFLVVAKTDPSESARGISLICMETEGAAGFQRGRNLDKVGMPAADTSEFVMEDVRVPRFNLLGNEEGQGFYQLMNQLSYERLLVAAGALGMSELAVDETVRYVKDRTAFGKRIFDFQNTRFTLAECKTKLEVMRAFVDRCVARQIAGDLDTAMASMSKWWCTDTMCEIVDECVQLHGGYGYMNEYTIARLYADARVTRIYAGTNEIQKELIARSLDV